MLLFPAIPGAEPRMGCVASLATRGLRVGEIPAARGYDGSDGSSYLLYFKETFLYQDGNLWIIIYYRYFIFLKV